ncbi:hypothetical protein E2C01_061087 [Portunus trituberculatus]|uniref:Uncharacterized protein n=1 Tax=Portunus trituberculatus TaxID=210409 RepID=A0A5B7HAS0_PORTR|nr:hypothetical protein [Portunus trituberculatus]
MEVEIKLYERRARSRTVCWIEALWEPLKCYERKAQCLRLTILAGCLPLTLARIRICLCDQPDLLTSPPARCMSERISYACPVSLPSSEPNKAMDGGKEAHHTMPGNISLFTSGYVANGGEKIYSTSSRADTSCCLSLWCVCVCVSARHHGARFTRLCCQAAARQASFRHRWAGQAATLTHPPNHSR